MFSLHLALLGAFATGGGDALAELRPQAAEEAGFTSLFDGQTFKGWEGNEKRFRIEDGAIVGGTLKEKNRRG